jgi:hypothetical protein
MGYTEDVNFENRVLIGHTGFYSWPVSEYTLVFIMKVCE